ncbi:MAG TPA: dual specificity protein phosphatase [Anaerolineales bacterium]|nr:dual specificity protein phosphatase [Anaerolineales bacterium]
MAVIGSYRDTKNLSYLTLKSIRAMLQFAERVEQPGITSLYLPVEDLAPISGEHIRQGLDFIKEHKTKGNRVLVACGAGMNRSSAFSAAALKETENLSLFEAFKQVKHCHPESMPHQPVWESLCQYYGEEIPYLEIMRLGFSKV